MWEEENSRKKSKGQRLFSQGVVVLVCLILAGQAAFFVKYIIDSRRTACPSGQFQQETKGTEVPDGTQSETERPAPAGSGAAASASQTYTETGQDRTPEGNSRNSLAAGKSEEQPSPPEGQSDVQQAERREITVQDNWRWDLVELNSADSAALDALPGIGPYYARQILAYRQRLGFYADISQLLDIRGFDTARLNRLADRIYIDPASVRPLDLYSLSIDSMAAHPYIGPYAAKGLDRLRRSVPRGEFTMQTIIESKILQPAMARRLALYFQ